MPNVVTFSDIIEFYINKWAPVVDALHSRKLGLVIDFVTSVLDAIRDLPTNEVNDI